MAIADIIDAVTFGSKVHEEEKQNKKWRLVGAGLLLLLGVAGLAFAVIEWGIG